MCDFCKDIKRISYGEEIECTETGFAREKIILCYIDDKLCFYGFNKYHYEDEHITETWISIIARCAVESWWKSEIYRTRTWRFI